MYLFIIRQRHFITDHKNLTLDKLKLVCNVQILVFSMSDKYLSLKPFKYFFFLLQVTWKDPCQRVYIFFGTHSGRIWMCSSPSPVLCAI